ncbi:MAG: hypothetical protein IT190_08895, partial [Microbacteriaceae bacterium]|nr:hypothetical protein [Microbacteriaceae bacterium]
MTSTPRTLLLVDDHDILYRAGLHRRVQPLTRHAQNPVIVGRDQPWEIAIGWCSVYHDPTRRRYQLWYQAFAGHLAQERTHRCVVCYAESTDGVHWIKPDLGLYSFNGNTATNIVLLGNGGYSDRYGCAVVVDPHEPDAARRYKMAYFDFSMDQGQEYPGLSVAFAPDGIHWTKAPQAPLLRAAYGDRGDTVPLRGDNTQPWLVPLSISDAVDVFYDPPQHCFTLYHKMWIDGPDGRMFWKHGMGRTQSQNFMAWTRPQLLLTPDEFDPPWVEFHHSPVFYYNDCYFALLQILNRAERGGIMDGELALSRDGVHWQRPFRQPFFLPRSSGNHFDSGSILTNGTPVFLPDEFRFYYGGYSEGATGADDYSLTTGIGLATLPRDRFVALSPQQQEGQVTLKAVDLTQYHSLTLNANAGQVVIYVELLDADGRRLPGFTRAQALPITG